MMVESFATASNIHRNTRARYPDLFILGPLKISWGEIQDKGKGTGYRDPYNYKQ